MGGLGGKRLVWGFSTHPLCSFKVLLSVPTDWGGGGVPMYFFFTYKNIFLFFTLSLFSIFFSVL